MPRTSDTTPHGVRGDGDIMLRLLWPQWQGAGSSSVRALASEFPSEVARRGYVVGSRVLDAVLPEHSGPTASVAADMDDEGLEMHLQALLEGFPLRDEGARHG